MLDVPATINWYVTKRCNLVCTHCYNYEDGEVPRAKQGELDREEAMALGERLVDAGVFMINLIGGEPLTVPWLVDLVRVLADGGIRVSVATNGTLLDEVRIAALLEAGVSRFQISLDGATPEVHDAIRGKGNFARALRGLRLLRKAGHDPQVAFTLMKSNQGELEPLVALLRREGIGLLKLSTVIPSGRAQEDLDELLTGDALRARINWLHRVEKASRGALHVDYPCFVGHIDEKTAKDAWKPAEKAHHLSCGAGMTRAVIWEDGSVGACDFMREDHVGDLRKDAIKDIWTSDTEEFARWRRLDKVENKCGSCGYQAKCGFGCRASAYFGGGDFYGWDPMCISTPPQGVEHPWEQSRPHDEIRATTPLTKRRLPVLSPRSGAPA